MVALLASMLGRGQTLGLRQQAGRAAAPLRSLGFRLPKRPPSRDELLQFLGEKRTIPHILHQSWKDGSLPPAMQKCSHRWDELHPDWKHLLWTDAANAGLQNASARGDWGFYQALPFNISRADVSRLYYMREYGGLYADLDVYPCRNLRFVLSDDRTIVLVRSRGGSVSNFFIASVAGHPFWDFALFMLGQPQEQRFWKARAPLGASMEVLAIAGPTFMERAWDAFLFYAGDRYVNSAKVYNYEEFEEMIASHANAGSWLCDTDTANCDRIEDMVQEGASEESQRRQHGRRKDAGRICSRMGDVY